MTFLPQYCNFLVRDLDFLPILILDATAYLLTFGCTLCPASLIVRPWLTTWSTKVARISSEIMVLGLPHPPPLPRPRPPRPPPLTLTPLALALPLFPMLASGAVLGGGKQRVPP